MDSFRTPSPAERDAGVERLRSMTATAAVAGMAAVVTFGVVAAISNPGHAVAASSTGTTSGSQNGITNGSSGTNQTTPNFDDGSNQFFQAPAQQPDFFGNGGSGGTFSGGGHSTTGGS
jgi:hypothetical protein